MEKDKKICKCKKVTCGEVLAAMDKGAKFYKGVQKATGVASGCGDRKKDIKKLMKKQEDKGKTKKDEKVKKKEKKN